MNAGQNISKSLTFHTVSSEHFPIATMLMVSGPTLSEKTAPCVYPLVTNDKGVP